MLGPLIGRLPGLEVRHRSVVGGDPQARTRSTPTSPGTDTSSRRSSTPSARCGWSSAQARERGADRGAALDGPGHPESAERGRLGRRPAWINPSTLLERFNFAVRVATGRGEPERRRPADQADDAARRRRQAVGRRDHRGSALGHARTSTFRPRRTAPSWRIVQSPLTYPAVRDRPPRTRSNAACHRCAPARRDPPWRWPAPTSRSAELTLTPNPLWPGSRGRGL